MDRIIFPKDFFWGANTPIFSLEEYSPNITNKEEKLNCFSKNLNKQTELLKKLDLNAYRFSIDWNYMSLDQSKCIFLYRDFINKLSEMNIEPIVTLIDMNFPFSIEFWNTDEFKNEENGDFLSAIKNFVEAMSNKVQYYSILNDPMVFLIRSFLFKGKERLAIISNNFENLFSLYSKAYIEIKKINPYAKCSVSENFANNLVNNSYVFNNLNKNIEAIDYFFSFFDTLVYGKNKLFEDKEYNKSSIDFIGINFNNIFSDMNEFDKLIKVFNQKEENKSKSSQFKLEQVLKESSKRFDLPILISENSIEQSKERFTSNYLINTLYNVNHFISENRRVFGYIYNSLVDHKDKNLVLKNGLYSVDFENQFFTLRNFAKIYSNIAKENEIRENYLKYIE